MACSFLVGRSSRGFSLGCQLCSQECYRERSSLRRMQVGDIFVMPFESETLGLAVLEAMSSGLPVVAASAGGIPNIIPSD